MNLEQYSKLVNDDDYYKRVANEDRLLVNVNGSIVLENVLKNNMPIDNVLFNKKESIELIIKYKRYDLLGLCTVKNLLRKMDSNKTYLDYILEQYLKNKSFNISFCDPLDSHCSLSDAASFYITYAKYGLEKYLPIIDDEEFVKKEDSFLKGLFNNNKTFIKLLVEKSNKEFVKEKFLSNSKYQDIEVLIANNSSEDIAKTDKLYDFTVDYLDNYYDTIVEQVLEQMNADDKKVLGLLYKSIENRCSEMHAALVLVSYSMYIYKNRSEAYKEIQKLIDIFKNDDTFTIVEDKGSYFSPVENKIALEKNCVDTINHEFGHMFLHKLTDCNVDYKFLSILDNIRSDYSILDKLDVLTQVYYKHSESCHKKALDYYDNNVVPYVNDLFVNKKEEYDDFLNTSKADKIEEYVKKGYSRELLERLFNKAYSEKTYYNQYLTIEKKELKSTASQVELYDMQAIGDIIDAIFRGHYSAGELKSSSGKTIKCIGGHGIYYYNASNLSVYDEIFANYMSIRKSIKNKVIYIDKVHGRIYDPVFALRLIVGNELVDYLEDVYQREVLNSPVYTEGRSL